jgi:hypothetical protein
MAMKIGTNLAGLDENAYTERAFLNELKDMGGYFTYTAPGGSDTGEEILLYQTGLDANGYCTSFGGFSFGALLMMINGNAWPSNPLGTWVFMCDLNGGTPAFNFTSGSCVSSVDSSNAASGRWLLTINSNSAPIKIWQTATGTPHATNFRLIYGGVENVGDVASTAGTGGGTVVGVNGVGTREALYNSGEIFNPTFIAKMAPYTSIRFMQWTATIPSMQVNWPDRRPVGWVSYCDGIIGPKLYNIGPNPDQNNAMQDGVPYEVCCSLCNKLNADMHINIPALATDDYVTQLATLVHSNLSSGLKCRVEYSNELWNQQQFNTVLGTITASAAAGVLNVTSVAGLLPYKLLHGIAGSSLKNNGNNLNGTYPVLIDSFGTGTGGTGTYNLSQPITFVSETVTVWLDMKASISNLAVQAAPSFLNASNYDCNTLYSAIRASQVGNIWKKVWGADASRVIRIFGGQSGNDGYNQFFLPYTRPTDATFTGTISGGTTLTVSGVTGAVRPHALLSGPGVAAQTYIQSGSGTTWTIYPSQGAVGPVSMSSGSYLGTVASNVDELTTAPYFGAYDGAVWSDMPYAWDNNVSIGITKVGNAVLNGGDIPFDDGGRTIHSADGGANFTLTSGQGLSGTPPALTMTSGKFDTATLLGAHIVVDSCLSFPILAKTAAIGAGQVPINAILALCFDSVAGGWQLVTTYSQSGFYRIDNVPGGSGCKSWIASNSATAAAHGVALSCYESGQSFVTNNGTALDDLWKNFWRSSNAYTVFLTYLKNMNNSANIAVFHHFNDIGPFTFGIYWGAEEYVTQTPNSPRKQAIIDFIASGVAKNIGGRPFFLTKL